MKLSFNVFLMMFAIYIFTDDVIQTTHQKNLRNIKYWEAHFPSCKYDYIVEIILHAIFVTIASNMPIIYYVGSTLNWMFYVAFVMCVIEHIIAETAYVNRKPINLLIYNIANIFCLLSMWVIISIA